MSGAALSGRRATREEINHLLTELGNLGFYDICEEYEVCGSYRRGKHESGDIDIVFLPKSKEVYENWFTSLEITKREGMFANNVLIKGVQIDLFEANESSYPTMVMTWTGSRGFNMRMRGKSHAAGYVYTRHGMYDGKTGEIISGIKTEKDIFNLIGIDYVDPQRR